MKSFKAFRLDTANHILWRDGDRVPMAPKGFDVLAYLVEHAGRVVTQGEILEALWRETYVNPEILRKYILEIRRALGDRANNPEFIETLPKRGYQFIAAVTDESTAELQTCPRQVQRKSREQKRMMAPQPPFPNGRVLLFNAGCGSLRSYRCWR
jgi:DNA-binding winged helix-turn-helix (wHTH) protein